MSDLIPDQPLTLYDRVSVLLYRTGLAMAAAGIIVGYSVTWFRDALGEQGRQMGTCFLLMTAVGISFSVGFLHLYAAAIRRGLRWVWGAALLGLAVAVSSSGDPVAFYFGRGYGTVLGALWIACYAILCVKEAFCFRLYEGYAFAVLAPVVIVAHLFAMGTPAVRMAGWGVLAGLVTLFTLRKLPQPLYYDIGDKSKYQ
ncbi:MAG: DUF2301 domain-containing membrane protein [Nitrospirota bacterium]